MSKEVIEFIIGEIEGALDFPLIITNSPYDTPNPPYATARFEFGRGFGGNLQGSSVRRTLVVDMTLVAVEKTGMAATVSATEGLQAKFAFMNIRVNNTLIVTGKFPVIDNQDRYDNGFYYKDLIIEFNCTSTEGM